MIKPVSKQRRAAELAFAKLQATVPPGGRGQDDLDTATRERAARAARLREARLSRDSLN